MDWIARAPAAPYFVDESGRSWTPIGQNDSISWPDFAGLRGRQNLPAVVRHLAWLADHGVTCLRLMLEYAETGQHFFECTAGVVDPEMVGLWDDLFRLVEAAGLRILLTPMDTYFQWVHWDRHPYNVANGGPCASRTRLMTCPATRDLIKQRLAFATRRWGGSGVIFAWDLWNEMHPVQGEDRPNCFEDYIDDVSPFLRSLEREVHGRAHLQCVSVFGPELRWKPWLNEPIFRHPSLDFASSHFYAEGTIDDPQDTVAPALSVAELTAEALAEITDGRPFLDSEHGPIHTFKDHGITLPEPFDDECFRHIQWTHLACGGVGGGMRWPNRHPHVLTRGMRLAQRSLHRFTDVMDWPRFARGPWHDQVSASDAKVALFASGDGIQVLIYALRKGPFMRDGRLQTDVKSTITLTVSNLRQSECELLQWNTILGRVERRWSLRPRDATIQVDVEDFGAEAAFVVRPLR